MTKQALRALMLNTASPVPIGVWIGLVAAIVMDTAVQLVWKKAIMSVDESASLGVTVLSVIRHPLFWPLLALFLAQLFCWLVLLGNADLSYVMPITGLSYVTVAMCAAVMFGEKIGLLRVLGILLIVVGVWMTSNSGHRTVPVASTPSRRELP